MTNQSANFIADWACLKELRQEFLNTGTEVASTPNDYWRSVQHLEQYDQTFARRIAWKWQGVLKECRTALEALIPELKQVVDLGCGTGVAAEALCTMIPGLSEKSWQLTDRSARARSYARRKLEGLFQLKCSEAAEVRSLAATQDALFIASHLLTELDERSLSHLPELLQSARAFLFVEPGTSHASRRLIKLREKLLQHFVVMGPCFHQKPCPLAAHTPDLPPKDWCHQSLHPPSEIFHSKFWHDFSTQLGIDLRSLPVAWLFMVRKPYAKPLDLTEDDPARLLGRPDVLKASVEMRICDSSGIVRDYRIQKRNEAELYKTFKKGKYGSVLSAHPEVPKPTKG